MEESTKGYLQQPPSAQPGQIVTQLVNMGKVYHPAGKKWYLHSKGPNPKRYELRECKEELKSQEGDEQPGCDQPGSSTDWRPQIGGKISVIKPATKAGNPQKEQPVIVTKPPEGRKMKKPLDPRPRPREYQTPAQRSWDEYGAQEVEAEVEYYWNRNPMAGAKANAKPKPPPPRLMEQFLAARQEVTGGPLQRGWAPPSPPATVSKAPAEAGTLPVMKGKMTTQKPPLRPMPYGPIPKKCPLGGSMVGVCENKMDQVGCSLQLCPIWVLQEGDGKLPVKETKVTVNPGDQKRESNKEPVVEVKERTDKKDKHMEVILECEETTSGSESTSREQHQNVKMKKKRKNKGEKGEFPEDKEPKKKKEQVVWLRIGGEKVKACIKK